MSRIITILIFLITFPSLLLAQIPGTNGLFNCTTDDNGKRVIVTFKRANSFSPPVERKIKKKVALDIMRNKVLPEQASVINRAVKLNKRLRETVQTNSDQSPAFSLLSTKDQKMLPKLINDAIKTGHLDGGSGPSINSSAIDVLSALEKIVANQKKVRDDYRNAVKVLKSCEGCAVKNKRDLQRNGKKKKKKKKKRKCSKCQEGEHPAQLAWRSDDFGTCACFNLGFVTWDESLSVDATSVTAVAFWAGGNPRDFTETMSAPHDNVYSVNNDEIILTPDAGMNWIQVTYNGGADFNVDRCAPDCSDGLANLKKYVVNPRVRITCK